MKPKWVLIVAAFLLIAGAGAGNKAEAAPVSAPAVNHFAVSGSTLLSLARWSCWTVPGSGLGRQCRWVEDRWRYGGPGSGTGTGGGPGPRCWTEPGIPGSGLGPQRVCR
jgi:hypothetical protein